MDNMGKSFALILILTMVVSSLTLMDVFPLVKAQTGTNVSSHVINQDTTWTEAGSPYMLMGPIGVATGVTLTIEAGVTVNLGSSWINLNGTLNAQGSSTDKVIFTMGYIVVGNNANSVCNIENAILSGTSIQSSGGSVTANNCVFNGGGGVDASAGSAIITNNYISGGVTVADSSTVSNNSILGGILTTGYSGGVLISENNVTNPGGKAMDLYGTGKISDNIISGGSVGIAIEALSQWTIEGNLITNNQNAISISTSINSLLPPASDNSIIENNTIANNGEGIAPLSQENIIFNNFQNNGAYNLENGGSPVNATYNWWGTTDIQAINQTIFDKKNDYNLGTVTFAPFLTTPNAQAPPIVTPVPPLTPTSSPTHSPSSPSQSLSPKPSHSQTPTSTSTPASSGINSLLLLTTTIALVVIAFLLAVIIALLLYLRKRNRSTGLNKTNFSIALAKSFALILILIMAISIQSLMIVEPVCAQTTPTPPVPTFTVTLTNASYSVPPTYYIDPQTGANITKAGYFVNDENLTFTIQNQPNVTFYFVRWTTPYMTGWNYIEGYYEGDVMNATLERTPGSTTNWVLTGTYGTFPIYVNGNPINTVYGYSFPFGFQSLNFESGAKIEFQVQASNGSPQIVPVILNEHFSIIGETSGWSNTQTITIPASSTSSASPNPTPTVPEFPSLIVLPLLITMLFVAVILRLKQKLLRPFKVRCTR